VKAGRQRIADGKVKASKEIFVCIVGSARSFPKYNLHSIAESLITPNIEDGVSVDVGMAFPEVVDQRTLDFESIDKKYSVGGAK